MLLGRCCTLPQSRNMRTSIRAHSAQLGHIFPGQRLLRLLDFSQKVESLEVNHAPVTEVGPNEEFGLKVG
jgi:hypothetical protein